MGDKSVLERPHRVLLGYNHASVFYLGIRHKLSLFLFFFFFFGFVLAVGSYFSNQVSNPCPLQLEAWNLHHWTTREVPRQSVIKIFPILLTFFPPHKTCPWITMTLVPSLFFFFLVMRLLGFTSPRFFGVLIVMEES